MPHLVGPTEYSTSPIALAKRDEVSVLSQRLFRFYGSRLKGRNLYVLLDGTITENFPAATYDANGQPTATSWDQITQTYWGGHNTDLTADQAQALIDQGYGEWVVL